MAFATRLLNTSLYRFHRQCKIFTYKQQELCKTKKHQMTYKKRVKKRFFRCFSCQEHITALGVKMPPFPCHRCGVTNWRPASMLRVRLLKKPLEKCVPMVDATREMCSAFNLSPLPDRPRTCIFGRKRTLQMTPATSRYGAPRKRF